MKQPEVVAHFVGGCAVHVVRVFQLAFGAKHVVQNGHAVKGVAGGAEVGITLDAVPPVVPVDFWNDEKVEVILAVPRRQGLDRNLVGARLGGVHRNPVLEVFGHGPTVHADDAVGGFVVGRAFGQLKLDVRVHPQAIAVGAGKLPKVFVQCLDGRKDLLVRDVFSHAHVGAAVNHVNHHWYGVFLHHGAVLFAHPLDGFLHGKEASLVRL